VSSFRARQNEVIERFDSPGGYVATFEQLMPTMGSLASTEEAKAMPGRS
jgi:hypothetical protein